jgi:GGDEF domain-containing protein
MGGVSAMALSGPVIVVADDGAQVREALARGGNLPTRHLASVDAAKIAKFGPSAVVLAGGAARVDRQRKIAAHVEACAPLVPIIAVLAEPDPSLSPHVLPVLAGNVAAQLVPRLRAALRVRALHATILRRLDEVAERTDAPEFPRHDPLEDATVLVAGRGRNYPALTVAVGERIGLIGALSLDTARSYLSCRDIDGVVIGDGFNRSMVEDFMDELSADPRWRDLPVIVPRDTPDLDPERMPYVDGLSGDPQAIAAHILPLARLHAFTARLKRVMASLDKKGVLAPNTGLMTQAAFMGELGRAAGAAARGAGLSLARLSFDALPRRASVDAARITGRLLRASDIACRDEDGSILIAFTETDLVTAHVVARRIASVLKHTTLALGSERTRLGPAISLAAFRARDTVETLLARTIDQRMVAAE